MQWIGHSRVTGNTTSRIRRQGKSARRNSSSSLISRIQKSNYEDRFQSQPHALAKSAKIRTRRRQLLAFSGSRDGQIKSKAISATPDTSPEQSKRGGSIEPLPAAARRRRPPRPLRPFHWKRERRQQLRRRSGSWKRGLTAKLKRSHCWCYAHSMRA